MKNAWVDANVILRFLTGEPAEMADRAERLFQLVDDGSLQLLLDDIVLAEVVWVLSSYYERKPTEIAPQLRTLVANEGIVCADKLVLLQALTLFEEKNVDFADALLAVRATASGASDVYSFDRHFDRIAGINRLEPA